MLTCLSLERYSVASHASRFFGNYFFSGGVFKFNIGFYLIPVFWIYPYMLGNHAFFTLPFSGFSRSLCNCFHQDEPLLLLDTTAGQNALTIHCFNAGLYQYPTVAFKTNIIWYTHHIIYPLI